MNTIIPNTQKTVDYITKLLFELEEAQKINHQERNFFIQTTRDAVETKNLTMLYDIMFRLENKQLEK